MELWKVHRFCQHATLAELKQKHEEVSQAMLQGRLDGTNAAVILAIVRQYLLKKEVDELFGQD